MNKQIQFNTSENHIIFEDSQNSGHYYCTTREEVDRKNLILEGLKVWEEKEVPSEYTIEVLPLGKVKEDQNVDEYDITTHYPIDFPINRIKWIWIRLIHNPLK